MREIILAVALGVMVTSNAWANNCEALPIAWRTTPQVVRIAVEAGLNDMYAASPVPHTPDTEAIQACLLGKTDFFVESIIMHCNLGVGDQAEFIAFNAILNLCAKELGYD